MDPIKMKIPVVVCEYHQEVLQYIHRLIARKKLPFNGIKMVHFDSHPDLAYPERLSADDCYCKEKMYTDLDIADWILPLMYAGHIDHLIWVKPPWADQIPDKKLNFAVGKEIEMGHLKVTCTEDYFLEDCTFTPRSKLTNIKDVIVESIELKSLVSKVRSEKGEQTVTGSSPCKKVVENCILSENIVPIQKENQSDSPNCKSGPSEGAVSSGSCKRVTVTEDEKISGGDTKKKKVTSSDENNANSENTTKLLTNEKYILDIDLDFFSVTNPFLQDYTGEQFRILKETYDIRPPSCKKDETNLEEWVSTTRTRLGNLMRIIDLVSSNSNLNDVETEENTGFIKLLESLKDEKKDIEWELVHNAGMSMGVPHHISSENEIDYLVGQMVELLKDLPIPSAITVARSTVDEYCPPDQIELIQEKVLSALKIVYSEECLEINYDYNDESRLL